MARRKVRKLTCWSEEEWSRIADAARAAGAPPLRFVRDAALEKAGTAPRSTAVRAKERTTADELVHQLARVLNNLRQLHRVAVDDWDDDAAALLETMIEAADAATAAVPTRSSDAAAVLAVLVPTGVALNEMAHRANDTDALPAYAALRAMLGDVYKALRPCLK